MEGRMLLSRDKTGLYCRLETAARCKASVLLVHGLCEHQGRYDGFAGVLLEAGFNVCRFDLRGHGRSEGAETYFGDYGELLEDIDAAVSAAHEEWPDAPLYILGHSMGGFGAAAYGAANPNRADGYILSGAATWDNTGAFKGVPKDAEPKTYAKNSLASSISRDAAVVAAYLSDPFVARQTSLGLYQAISRGQDWLKENAAAFVDPVFILHGTDDKLVSEKDSRDFAEGISSGDKTLRLYPGLYHEILNEPEKDEVIADIVEWILARL